MKYRSFDNISKELKSASKQNYEYVCRCMRYMFSLRSMHIE